MCRSASIQTITASCATIAVMVATACLVVVPAAQAQCAPEWVLKSDVGPRSRQYHAMAYDSRRHSVFLQGGNHGFPNETDLWEWNGTSWVRWPSYLELAHHAMVYDERRGALIIFGGADGYQTESGDTWAYDGERWTLVTSAGPVARTNHCMAYDSWRGVTVLFGGGTASHMRNTWELHPSGWRRVATTGPSARSGAAMAFDRHRGVTVMQGGFGDPVGETWEWDGMEWSLVSVTGPGRRASHSMVYDEQRRRVVLVGGDVGFDTWEWDGNEWELITDTGPRDRFGSKMAYDASRGQTVLFGGYADGVGYLNDTWEYGLPNPFLIVDATCPTGGAMSIRWSCATPGKTAALVYSPAHGMFTIPNNQPCAGTALDLNPSGLQLVWTGRTGHDGSGVIRTQAGPPACGSYLQFIDVDSCRVSAAVRVN